MVDSLPKFCEWEQKIFSFMLVKLVLWLCCEGEMLRIDDSPKPGMFGVLFSGIRTMFSLSGDNEINVYQNQLE